MSFPGFALGQQLGEQNLAHRRSIEDEQRQAKLGLLTTAYQQTQNPEQRQAIQDAIGQLYPAGQHHNFLRDIFHLRGGQPPTAQNPSPAASAPAGETPQGAALSSVKKVGQASTPEDAVKIIAGIPSMAQVQAETLKQQEEAARDLANIRANAQIEAAKVRGANNITHQKYDADARKMGYPDWDSAPPEAQMKIVSDVASAGRAHSWKSELIGNDIYAVDSQDPTQKTLIGQKDDLTQHLEYKTMTNPDGSQYLVPVTTWTKKGSSTPIAQTVGDPGQAPVSSKTPTPPQSVGASNRDALNSKLNRKKPQSKHVPTSSRTPLPPGVPKGAIPFGSKGSPLLKSDTQEYTVAHKDAITKKEAYDNAKSLLSNPQRQTDLELIFAWVRANVQGAGRMTTAEISQATKAGSYGERIKNAYTQASTGRLAPELETQFLTDIKNASDNAQKEADDLRGAVERDMSTPVSSKTPDVPKSDSKVDDFLKNFK